MARPIPWAPPVTSATFPASFPSAIRLSRPLRRPAELTALLSGFHLIR